MEVSERINHARSPNLRGPGLWFNSSPRHCRFIMRLPRRERAFGVDPFYFTLFSWLVAGRGSLAIKISRVSDWTWREFLLRQVTCRTAREIATVSGLDPQDILIILLSSNCSKPMDTTGPYQTVFGKERVKGGFSIDVKTEFRTFVNCGLLPTKVQTLEGPALLLFKLVVGFSGLQEVMIPR
ncbi:hypothetical protein BDP55DRAFT_715511 [Colletotrichum godetiae]|uniref:Uncharacterized protein n=1 Tax=Colletotrichum godetiae TaxID=1209918 RepID=A0AAJ0AM97_9PEZI|nr:uncharacterized protein BDP55DRAFT_715511 [Colletotrichum godetiae]KAK1675854.1 hypothetical protein BDP55DRAFT_715511 [Colletotrichum godetiae]